MMRTLTILAAFCHAISTVSAVFNCEPGDTTAFVRVSRARVSGSPVVVSTTGDDLTCAQYCRNNIEPTTGAERACAAFNFDGRETCYFFQEAATPGGSAVLAPNPSANNFYYEKICIPDVSAHQACTYRSYTFERKRRTSLEGFVRKSVHVSSREHCLSACLREEQFVCRSVNYNYDNNFCEMSTEDRRSKPNQMRRRPTATVDYFDNNCLSRQNRCGRIGGNLVFIKTSNFEIHHYDHTSSAEAHESECLQKCLDSLNTFCRSVEFSPSSNNNCIVSDEDTFSRADQQGPPTGRDKDYYEPMCVAADLSSSTCRQQAAFERFLGTAIQGQPVASAQGVTVADCVSLCFQNLQCKSINYDRTKLNCFVYKEGRATAAVENNPAVDYYEFNCESQFGGMALCTNGGIRFVMHSKEPYTGAVYAAEHFGTCSQVVQDAQTIQMTFPPPTISSDCGTVLRDGKLEARVVVSLDGVLPHQVTTEWDRFYRISCDTSMVGVGEGSVVVTTIYDAGQSTTQVLTPGTPGPMTATLRFVDDNEHEMSRTTIGEDILMVVHSAQTGPQNMMLMDCTATRVGGHGDTVPFKVIDDGCPRYPALVGPVEEDMPNNRLTAHMKAFRLDGSYDLQMLCQVMFCAGPGGCPPSNCLDSGSNRLFESFGRKKRSPNTVGDVEGTRETLSTIIRVLAEGELEEQEDGTDIGPADLTAVQSLHSADLLCLSTSHFLAIFSTVILLSLLFCTVVFTWMCRKRTPSGKLPKHNEIQPVVVL